MFPAGLPQPDALGLTSSNVIIIITYMSATNVQFSVAAHVMVVLGFHHGEDLTSATLAESVNADPSFVRRTLSKLAKSGLVIATRGKNGASILARPPNKITMLEIYRASEAPRAFAIHAYAPMKSCSISCNIKRSLAQVLDEAQGAFEASLAKQRLAEVIADVRRGA
ncbi:MAG: Rrf2 family transcriptional regulator [Nevskia sp.]|nr:Rrf2 family transcriptional regulator [Nevskia sp.]